MVQLKTEQQFKWGQKNIIPFVGEVSISSEGIIEVASQELAEQIVQSNVGFSIIEKVGKTTTTTTQQSSTTTTTTSTPLNPKTEEDDLGDKGGNENDLGGGNDEKDELLKSLEGKSLAELKELAKPFPSAEWRSLNKEKLTDYLKSKL